jgi:hypothetical protein
MSKRDIEDHKAELNRLKKLRNEKGSPRSDKIFEAPRQIGIPWTLKPRALTSSRVWKSLGLYELRFLTGLEDEHCSHAGTENGNLVFTFEDGVTWGIPRGQFNRTKDRLCDVKLIQVTHKGSYAGAAIKDPNRYRITYLRHTHKGVTGPPVFFFPTHDWIEIELATIEGKRTLRKIQHIPPHLLPNKRLPWKKPSILEVPIVSPDRLPVPSRASTD